MPIVCGRSSAGSRLTASTFATSGRRVRRPGPSTGSWPRIPHDELGLIAECGGTIVALAQYAREAPASSRAEAAFLVADEMQGRGLGTRLLELLAEYARSQHISTFHSWVMGVNHRMLRVFVDSGFTVRSKNEQGVIEVVLSLDETPAHESRSAERAAVAARASLQPFFEPASVAVVGAARERGGIGAEILNNLRTTGFRGRIVPIHPLVSELQGLRSYPRLTDVAWGNRPCRRRRTGEPGTFRRARCRPEAGQGHRRHHRRLLGNRQCRSRTGG